LITVTHERLLHANSWCMKSLHEPINNQPLHGKYQL
jgi:hypothetical protein